MSEPEPVVGGVAGGVLVVYELVVVVGAEAEARALVGSLTPIAVGAVRSSSASNRRGR
jgi:hypothetical protein